MSYSPFIGTGLAYPLRLGETGYPRVATDEELIAASIDQILNTDVAERPFLTKDGIPYGTRIRSALFSGASAAISVIQYEIKRALATWEPRISITNVSTVEQPLSSGGSAIIVDIQYVYRSTNRPDNRVLQFDLKGT